MKDFLRSIAMSFSMFSVIPMPQVEWKKENMRYMLAMLPLVGVVIGGVLLLWYRVCALLSFGPLLSGAGLALLPLFLSGGVHMDGFCDTVDALASHAPVEKKRTILKDSHTGAFAVIGCASYLILYTAVCSEFSDFTGIFVLAISHVTARAAAGIAGTLFPVPGETGLLATFHRGADRRAGIILILWFLAGSGVILFLSPIPGIAVLIATVLLLLYVKRMSVKEFGGMSGDLAGFLSAAAELLIPLVYLAAERILAL